LRQRHNLSHDIEYFTDMLAPSSWVPSSTSASYPPRTGFASAPLSGLGCRLHAASSQEGAESSWTRCHLAAAAVLYAAASAPSRGSQGVRQRRGKARSIWRQAAKPKAPAREDIANALRTISDTFKELDRIMLIANPGGQVPRSSDKQAIRAVEELLEIAYQRRSSENVDEELDQDTRKLRRILRAALAPPDKETDSESELLQLFDRAGDSTVSTSSQSHLDLKWSQEMKASLKKLAGAAKCAPEEEWEDEFDFKGTVPPAPRIDPNPEAVNARNPLATALEQAVLDTENVPGSSELPTMMVHKRSMTVGELLSAAGEAMPEVSDAEDTHWEDVEVKGLADVPSLALPGDAVLLEWKNPQETGAEVAMAVERGATALFLWRKPDSTTNVPKKSLLDKHPGLKTVAVLSTDDCGSRLAQAFYGNPSEKLNGKDVTVVIGDSAAMVHTTSWLLYGISDIEQGHTRSALLSSRRTMIGNGAADVGRPLTVCLMQEFLAEVADSEIQACIIEVVSGQYVEGALDGLQANAIIAAGATKEGGDLMTRLAEQAAADYLFVVPDDSDFAGQESAVTYSYEEPGVGNEHQAGHVSGRVLSRYSGARLGFNVGLGVDTGGESTEVDLPTLSEDSLQGALAAFAAAAAQTGTTDWDNERCQELGQHMSQVGQAPGIFEVFVSSPVSAEEARKNELPVIVYHEAKSPDDARNALQEIEKWRGRLEIEALAGSTAEAEDELAELEVKLEETELALSELASEDEMDEEDAATSAARSEDEQSAAGSEDELKAVTRRIKKRMKELNGEGAPQSTITAVFGCSSSTSPAERALYGWVLSEYANKIVLTTNDPEGEMPMQLIEDHLAAVRSWNGCQEEGERKAKKRREVVVIADRVDAIKQSIGLGCVPPSDLVQRLQEKPNYRNMVVVFGSAFKDWQQVVDKDGEMRKWYCNDRRIISESMRILEDLQVTEKGEYEDWEGFSVEQLPWKWANVNAKRVKQSGRKKVSLRGNTLAYWLPSRSLHWTDRFYISSDGEMGSPL